MERRYFHVRKGINYQAQCKAFSENGTFESWFSDHGNDLKAGFYTLQISCVRFIMFLPDEVKGCFWEKNRNIYGPGVKFDPISGNSFALHME